MTRADEVQKTMTTCGISRCFSYDDVFRKGLPAFPVADVLTLK